MNARATQQAKPVIAVTSGDPGGVGPEIVAKMFARHRPARSIALLVGSARVLQPLLEAAGGRIAVIDGRDEGAVREHRGRVVVLDTGCRARYAPGRDSRGGGRHAGTAVEMACRLAARGLVDALVTAPISKRSLALAGYPFTGHTEMFADFFDAPDCQMVMVYRHLRVVPLTRHIPVSEVSRALSQERLVKALGVVERALRAEFGIPEPHIAVSALNPHAGEGGVVGREEIDTIQPALRRARRMGIHVTGPVAGDSLFQHAGNGTFDALVSMYHDQGLIPFKMAARRRGVNVTVGLPVVRTSVDHGVAYDIVGKGVASTASLKAAYRLAAELVTRRIMGGRE
ncbi:MAG: 4-hydroxythreonine-4-phosphate dehydrogenase PdxA [Candidatus Krumholzibacteriia bacterium]